MTPTIPPPPITVPTVFNPDHLSIISIRKAKNIIDNNALYKKLIYLESEIKVLKT